jgi:WS/DGAT C-terminal domain/Wax ester synthase-like Acyl-CoA acyltransferase domain
LHSACRHPRRTRRRRSRRGIATSIRAAVTQVGALNQVSIGALRKTLAGLFGSHLEGSLPFTAQHAPTNEPLKIARRFATLSLPLEEMHEVGRHFGATLNDVAVTVVDAGLHAYLRETGRAFAHPFISMCPVSLRADGDTTIGTRVSAMFVRLGEPGATAPERIRQVVDSIATAKKELGGMSNDAAMTYAVAIIAIAGLAASTHLDRVAHPACNLAISNVPGAKEPRYLNGARLVGVYPVSALAASIGLNANAYLLLRPHGLRVRRKRRGDRRPNEARAPHAAGLSGTDGGGGEAAGGSTARIFLNDRLPRTTAAGGQPRMLTQLLKWLVWLLGNYP